MKPSDCQINDLQRYFDRSWLTHKSRGVLFVRTDGDRFLATDSTGQSTTLSLANFEPFYPLGRAINSEHYENMGIYVGRKARQTARRSASLCHYEVLFCPAGRRLVMDNYIMWDLINYTNYPQINKAIELLEEGRLSIAISPDLILCNSKDNAFKVIWRSMFVGILDNNLFIPEIEASCYTKLTRQAMQELGIECL